jgi:hypothetical protein
LERILLALLKRRHLGSIIALDFWVTLRTLYVIKRASTALAYENGIHQQRHKDVTCIQEHFNSYRLLVSQYRAGLAISRAFNN